MKPSHLAIIGWWGAFLAGPLCALIPLLAAPDQPLAKAHGKAAAIFWGAVTLLWGPAAVWLVISREHLQALLIGSLAMFLLSAVVCSAGTIQALRGRSLVGRQLAPSAF